MSTYVLIGRGKLTSRVHRAYRAYRVNFNSILIDSVAGPKRQQSDQQSFGNSVRTSFALPRINIAFRTAAWRKNLGRLT